MTASEGKSWIERRTRLEKCFFVALFILLLILVLFIIGFNCTSLDDCSLNSKGYCSTPGCIKAASVILEAIDTNVNPCDNFYNFACGNIIKKMKIPNDQLKVDPFYTVKDKVTQNLHELLEENLEKNGSKVEMLAKRYYRACMNEDYIEKIGQKRIIDLIKSLGGWPILEGTSWDETNFEWSYLTTKFRNAGISTDNFITFYIETDTANSSIRIIEIDQPKFGLARNYLTKGLHLQVYHDLMVNISVELGADKFTAERELNASLEFEIELSKIALPEEERRNYTLLYNPIKIKDLQKQYPNTKWLEFINAMLSPKTHVGEEELVDVVVPKFLSSFEELLQKTPKRVQANYAIWRAILHIIDYTPQSINKYYLEALSLIVGSSERSPRWHECVEAVSNSLSYAVGSLYVRSHFDEVAKSKAKEMVNYVKDEFVKLLENLDWMDDATKKFAMKKAKDMAYHIGYPAELVDDHVLNEYYKDLEILENEYLQSKLNINIHNTNFKYGRLHDMVNKSDWTGYSSAFKIGASYRASRNSFEISAAILQDNFFSKNRPAYLNFGAIGSIVAHELTHGFDDEGRQFDSDGNLNNWWAKNTEEQFLNKVQCIIDQYSNYTVDQIDQKVNGINTQGENIADNAGVKLAYLAYKAWIENNKAELKLPGLDYTPQKLFWISNAMNWCSKFNDEHLHIYVDTDRHSPNNFRVLGPLRNSEEFSRDFNCDTNTNMNPTNKCTVW